jgi:FKBP-type peptidyl-prolyl cis-trans isomerase
MIRKLLPGALALGLIAQSSAETPAETPAVETPAAEAPAATPPAAPAPTATTPPVEIPPPAPKPPVDPAVVKADSSYALGFRTGGSFAQQFGRFGVGAADLDTETFLKGFLAALKGDKPEIPEEKLQAAMEALGDVLQTREKDKAAANLAAGNAFLAENAKKEGVITTASGLQYEILEKGGDVKYVAPAEGAEDNKQFLVNYKGTLIDGTEFDASPEGQPVPMTLQVIDGFKEALTTMPVGAKWKLTIPSNLAYGEERRSAQIEPNSVLVFELELLKIEDAPPQPGGGLPFPMPQQ